MDIDLQNLLLATALPPLGLPWEEWYTVTRPALADWLEEHNDSRAADVRFLGPGPASTVLPIPPGWSLLSIRLNLEGAPQQASLVRVASKTCRVSLLSRWSLHPLPQPSADEYDMTETWEEGQVKGEEDSRLMLVVPSLGGGWVHGKARYQQGSTAAQALLFLSPVELAEYACRSGVLLVFAGENVQVNTADGIREVDAADLMLPPRNQTSTQ